MVDSAAEARLRAEARAKTAAIKADAYYVRDPKTGLSPAQVEANQAVAEAAASTGKPVIPGATGASATADRVLATPNRYYNYFTGEYVSSPDLIKPRTGMGGAESGGGTIDTGQFGSNQFTGSTGPTGSNVTIVSTYTDPNTGDVIAVYSDGTTAVLSKGTKATDAAAQAAAANLAAQQAAQLAAEEKRRQGQSAYSLLFSEFDRYGLGALVAPLQDFITEGLSPAEFTLRLRQTDAYKKRFAANAQRINRGLRALSEAEYIGLEDQYQSVMRNYGLPASYYARGDMGVQQGFEKFISGDVSAAELEDRIQTAQNRVINAAPEVSRALREFYPDITNGDILAYALDPDQALTNIKRKVTSAEIGAGAMQAGLATGLARAEELQRFGVTGEQARQGYQTIGSFLPRASQLGDIYAKQGEGPFTQTTAEQEVFGTTGAVEAQRKRRKLSELETAQFSGTSGASGGALARERAGQF